MVLYKKRRRTPAFRFKTNVTRQPVKILVSRQPRRGAYIHPKLRRKRGYRRKSAFLRGTFCY